MLNSGVETRYLFWFHILYQSSSYVPFFVQCSFSLSFARHCPFRTLKPASYVGDSLNNCFRTFLITTILVQKSYAANCQYVRRYPAICRQTFYRNMCCRWILSPSIDRSYNIFVFWKYFFQNLCGSEEALVETKFLPQQVLQFTSLTMRTTSKFMFTV